MTKMNIGKFLKEALAMGACGLIAVVFPVGCVISMGMIMESDEQYDRMENERRVCGGECWKRLPGETAEQEDARFRAKYGIPPRVTSASDQAENSNSK